MLGGHRSERIAEEIRNEVSLMLAGELKDPRLAGPVMVTEVRLGAGMRTVRVFVQLAEDDSERAETLAGLKAASFTSISNMEWKYVCSDGWAC